ncbi:hypothetical protein DBZ36_05340 [Alginatibacterium sediminis]|uniref:Urate oxidase N-terminal domain-containing protein n=1 Tax=Alginatibacterium sediminis TaxID=2164068 RepID=A0A420EGS8_9ALTE|nr:urate hydroxylase PuuD [Alginatibacterium sediminis]RKF19883.1 hypothetical protein DBZ36_05340 [Alginatibacterium sediminis]
MWPQFYEWIALFIKWFHVISAIAWIGASFYFTWLDNSLEEPPKWKKDKGIKGDLWAVHGGGFYEVAKYQAGPEQMPQTLHWFKWEAYTTWLTGSVLLIWMYYFNAQAYLIDPRVMALSVPVAVAMGIALVALGVVCYELLLRTKIATTKSVFVLALVILAAVFFYAFTSVFSGRGAFIHMGVLIGTIMVNNVFYKIIPGQRKMVAQIANGESVDPAPGLEGKRRSIHNNYFTLPIIFLMISNHYPMVYQHPQNWLVGLCIMVISAYIRHYFNLKHSGVSKPSVLIGGAIAMLLLALGLSWPTQKKLSNNLSEDTAILESRRSINDLKDHQRQALQIISQRCGTCHSSNPTDEVFTIAPSGAIFDSWEDVERWKPNIIARAVETADMPFLNKTEMSDNERTQLKQLLSQ